MTLLEVCCYSMECALEAQLMRRAINAAIPAR